LVVDLPQLLAALPGDEHLEVAFVGGDRGVEPGLFGGR
jgi:hypothetical protein